MKKNIVIMSFFMLILIDINAQTSSTTIDAGGMSAERLTRIDSVLNEYVHHNFINGAVVMIQRNNQAVYYKAIGYDDVEKKIPMKKDAIFRIASQTKAITSVAVMMLYEQGKLLLDDPISKYIPEFKSPQVLQTFNEQDTSYTTAPAKREITIRDLLTHTSGIGYAQIGSKTMNAIYAKGKIPAGISVDSGTYLADKMKLLSHMPLFHQPGEKWTYGLNTDVLGYLVEVVSQKSLAKFFKTQIFEPLGMKDTWFYLPADKKKRLVNLYTEEADSYALRKSDNVNFDHHANSNYPNSNGTYYSGGAGLSSTAADYSIFMQMLLNSGVYNGKRILSRNSVRIMTMNQIGELSLADGNKFGLGFEVVTPEGSAKSLNREGALSWGGAFASKYWIDPKEKMTVQLFLNIIPFTHGEIFEKFKTLVYQAIKD